jgi:hypothetical protein
MSGINSIIETAKSYLGTTEGSNNHREIIDLYNKAALEIMAKHKIPVIDLDNFTRTLGTDIYLNGTDPCHFNDAAQALQAAFICGQLLSFIR